MKKIVHTITILGFIIILNACRDSSDLNDVMTTGNDTTSIEDTNNKESQSCIMPISAEDSAKYVSESIEVVGEVECPLLLTVDSLKKMNVVTIDNFKVVCQTGTEMKNAESCKGVLLKDILTKAKIVQKNHKDRNFYIVARATDDYKATFSWAEIYNSNTGDNVYVIFEENGQPITVQGEMILICTTDIKTGPRHVYWLKSIEVYRVD